MNTLLTLNLKHLEPYLNNKTYTDISIKKEGEVWCKKWGGKTNPQSITRIY